MNNVKRFSDFAEEEGPLDGDKTRLDDILNHEILITGCRIQDSKYSGKNKTGKYLTVQFQTSDRPDINRVFFTGSDVLIKQMEKYAHETPFVTIIRKVDRYYTLT